jgi:hypothetical protein
MTIPSAPAVAAAALALVALPASRSGPHPELQRLSSLVGGVWVAEGELPGAGSYRAERSHAWALDSTYLRVHQTMVFDTLTIEEEQLIGWHEAEQRLHVWSFASDGSHSEGYAVPGDDARRWIVEGRTIGGRGGEWRTTLFMFDDDAFSLLLELRSGREFVPGLTLAFRRQR